MSVRRPPNIAYLSVGAAIGGLTSKFLEQVLTGQPLELWTFAWTWGSAVIHRPCWRSRVLRDAPFKAYIW